jgi:hypothetical protein|tara:strand:- start:293 stop:493 length:201 start_codon:yes stop_codon:yes gene_type:complete
MIELALVMLAHHHAPHAPHMTCEQTLGVIEVVMEDSWFAKPENLDRRSLLIRKLKLQKPIGCVLHT